MIADQRKDLLVEKVLDELMVFNVKRNEANLLNHASAIVFRLCDGVSSVADMCDALEAADISPATEEAVWVALDDLAKANLIDLHEKPIRRTTRREVLSRMSAGASAVALFSVITTITAPDVAAQISGTTA